MYEPKTVPPISRRQFAARMISHALIVVGFFGGALMLGVLGYHFVAGMSWIDALLNASMILGGMGPVDALTSDGAKVFASGYSLFSGLVFIGATSFIIAPVAHRVMHRLHWGDSDE